MPVKLEPAAENTGRVGFRPEPIAARDDLSSVNTYAARKERILNASAVLLISFALGWAVAQTATQTLESPKVVGGVLYTGTQEILVVTPSVRSKDVADGLRRAAVERGTPVYIIADAALVGERAGFLPGLSLVKNVQVRLLRGLTQSSAVVDRKLLISGLLLFDIPSPLETKLTEARTDSRAINDAVRWFTKAWKLAKPYKYSLAPMKP